MDAHTQGFAVGVLFCIVGRHLHLVPTCGDIGDNPEQPATPSGDAA